MQQRYSLMIGYMFSYTFISTLLFFTYYQLGSSLLDLSLYFVFMNLVSAIVIMTLRSVHTRNNFIFTFILMSALALYISTVTEKSSLMLVGAITGIAFYLFWVPINILFFADVHEDEHAFSSGKYYALFTLVRSVIPFLAGFLAAKYTHNFVYTLTSFLFALLIPYAFTLPGKKVPYYFRKTLKSMKHLSFLVFLEGFRGQLFFMAIPLFTLTFIHSEFKLGSFLSVLGLAGALASLVITKLSDQQKKRTYYLYPISLLLAFSSMALFFARSQFLWGVFSAVLFFLNTLAGPFEITVLIDHVGDKASLMAVREVLLAVGRLFASLVIAAVFLLTGTFYLSFLIIGGIYLLYPLVIYFKKVYQ